MANNDKVAPVLVLTAPKKGSNAVAVNQNLVLIFNENIHDVPLEWKNTVSGLNIIQAASQFGLSGTVKMTSPQMDLSGVLIGLNTSSFGRDLLSQDYCAVGAGSSLTVRGYGILPPTASDLLY